MHVYLSVNVWVRVYVRLSVCVWMFVCVFYVGIYSYRRVCVRVCVLKCANMCVGYLYVLVSILICISVFVPTPPRSRNLNEEPACISVRKPHGNETSTKNPLLFDTRPTTMTFFASSSSSLRCLSAPGPSREQVRRPRQDLVNAKATIKIRRKRVKRCMCWGGGKREGKYVGKVCWDREFWSENPVA